MSHWATDVFHVRCDDRTCYRRCLRPGCLKPESHFLIRFEKEHKGYSHVYDCRMPEPTVSVAAAAKQAIEELHPGMDPSEIAVARRVISRMLDQLEELKKEEDKPKEPFRPQIVAAPREITKARQQHEQWLVQRKERTA